MAEYNINIDRVGDDLNEAYDLGYESCMRDYHIKHLGEQQTNADRIRSMTDEELAMWINDLTTNALSVLALGSNKQTKTISHWYDWLRKEAESEGEDGSI